MVYKYGRSIPEFVKRFREDKGLTQWQLADLLGVRNTYVANVEQGRYINPSSFCAMLCSVMDNRRQRALFDLMMEAQAQRLVKRGMR